MEGQDKRRRTLTFVAVGAEVVGVRVLEGQQGAREGKREEFGVAAHGSVCWCCLVSPCVSVTQSYARSFVFLVLSKGVGVWVGGVVSVIHMMLFILCFVGIHKKGKPASRRRRRRAFWCHDASGSQNKRAAMEGAVKHTTAAHMGWPEAKCGEVKRPCKNQRKQKHKK